MRRAVAASLLALVGFLVVVGLRPTGAIERLELLTLDARYALGLGRQAPASDLVIAWIDQESMDYMDGNDTPFPWPRGVYAAVLEHLVASGARAVVFDVLFDQRGNAEDDRAFAAALTAARGDVLAMKFVGHRDGGRNATENQDFAARGLGAGVAGALARPPERGMVLPLAELVAGADQLGFVNIRPDADKTFRGYDLVRLWGPPGGPLTAQPSLALAGAIAAGAGGDVRLVAPGQLAMGDGPGVAIANDGRMLLNFRGGPFTFAKVKFVNILESINRLDAGQPPLYAADLWRDKIVLVGIHAEGYEDAHPTPLAERFPGVELHATALDNLRRGDALQVLDWELPLAAAAAALGTATVFLLPGVLWPAIALGLLAALGVAWVLWAWVLLAVVPVAAPALAGGVSAAGAFLYRLVVEGRQKRDMHRAFRSYLAPEVLVEVLRDPAALQLGGEVRDVTLFFTDLQGFTGLAEHSAPHELVAFLNDYFTRMCRPVLAERGVIDKFVGDAIMAFFGAPIRTADHGRAAVRAALLALQTSEQIAAEVVRRGIPPIKTRIGIHSGQAVIGNMGSVDRFDYTAIGDTVNLAARLEGANKYFGTGCLVSETAWAMAAAEVVGREVGRIGVVGRQEPIRVFEPLALRAAATPEVLDFAAQWAAAQAALQRGDRPAARTGFAACARLRPDDPLVALYLEKLLDPAFDGTFRLDAK